MLTSTACCVVNVCFTGDQEQTTRQIVVGDTVLLTCHTELDSSVVWRYQNSSDQRPSFVFLQNRMAARVSRRLRVDMAVKGDYNLIIRNVTWSDDGIYSCTENGGVGPGHSTAVLSVVGMFYKVSALC
jgi:hypothetical protein